MLGVLEDVESATIRSQAAVIQIKLLSIIDPAPASAAPNAFPSGPAELPFDVTIQRPHDADPGEHRRAAALGNQQQRFHRGLPFFGIVFGPG
jgi:hypothetical protein